MKSNSNGKKGLRVARFFTSSITKTIFFIAIILTGFQLSLRAQVGIVRYAKPTWRVGAAGGANFNFYRGTTQWLNDDLTAPAAFRHGKGVGLYLAPLVEFHRPDSQWGFMLQAGYDSRSGKFEQVTSPCNCPQDLSTKLDYVTIEPSLRFAPFKSNFYLFGGPRLALNTSSSFTFKLGVNPDFADRAPAPDVKDNFSNMNRTLISMTVGAGYDIPLSSDFREWQSILSPFVSYQPYFGQDPRSIETWTMTTLRVGAALKFGRGRIISTQAKSPIPGMEPEVLFSIHFPDNIPAEPRINETFPIRNYIFFDLGSTKIPSRYVLIRKDQVKDFNDNQLGAFTPKRLPGRSARQMTVYYNVLNILGDRMRRNQLADVRLTGTSMKGEKKDGLAMAESVKEYLVNVFAIAPARIHTEGRITPRLTAEQAGGTKELTLIREDDHRVSIWSESPAILQEYQTGSNVTLPSIELTSAEQAPLDSYVTFNVPKAAEAFNSWSLEVKDESGKVQFFGPYTQENVMTPVKAILGTRANGDYTVTMVAITKSGNTVRKETSMHLVSWTPPQDEMSLRFSVIYEFNDAKSSALSEKYLTDVVTPRIPTGATVILNGYTDTIGDEDYNKKLSLARANDVKNILESSLSKAGRTDVKIEVYAFGEDEKTAHFANNFPEERFYNRSVIIDIIPKK